MGQGATFHRSMTVRVVARAAVLAGLASGAAAQGVEVGVQAGPGIPTYKQTFSVTTGSPAFGVARLTQVQSGAVDAEGGLALGGQASLYLFGPFALEARLDSIAVDLKSFAGSYQIQAIAGGPTTVVTLGTATMDLRRVRPLSFNVKVQGNRRLSLGFSTGISTMRSASVAPASVSAGSSAPVPPAIELKPSSDRLWGVNGGLNLRIKVAEPASVFAEVRGFAFRKDDWAWTVNAQNLPSGVTLQAANAIVAALEAPAFTPGFWTGSFGVAITFR